MLTDAGREYARRVIRAHRLLETYLARETTLPPDQWHAHAERREHELTHAEVNALADQLGRPRFDPHGDPIPTREGTLPPSSHTSLAEWPVDCPARIAHIEDEPAELFQRITALGLAPGQPLVVTRRHASHLELNAQGITLELVPEQAAQISVSTSPLPLASITGARRLSQIALGETTRVAGIAPACRGPQRSRLLDLGVVPGSPITAELRGISASPVAYRLRGTLIALRSDQAELILVDPA